MKAGIIVTGTGPILILTSYDSLTHPDLVKKLGAKGISEFIGYELDWERVKDAYGTHFSVVMGDLHETDDLRVLDYNGHRVFANFNFEEMSGPIYHEPKREFHQAA
ncbi:MAG: hypothetical protein MUC41_02740 [Syntrophobacteraceae bacterium]|jgi:hypothetical protein|nr:hypothetical protein [Syntrophobacteraceae bacterium]